MRDKIVKPERRRFVSRQEQAAPAWPERRVQCWDLEPSCTEERRKLCAAYFVRRNCWDLWAAEYFPPGRKPCCHSDLDCSECPVATAKFGGPICVYVAVPDRSGARPPAASNRSALRCPHFYSANEASPGRGDAEARTVFRCRRRPGIQLHSSYVSDVCGSRYYRDCIFYDSE